MDYIIRFTFDSVITAVFLGFVVGILYQLFLYWVFLDKESWLDHL